MWDFDAFVSVVDQMLSTKRKRHLVGGALMSASLFFGGLAFTVLSLKLERRIINA